MFGCRGVGPSSTAKAHTEKLGVRSDAAPARDEPGLFIGLATNPELAQIARQTASRGGFKERADRTEPHGSVSWASMINTCRLGTGASCGWKVIQSFITNSGCKGSALAATSSSASGISRRKITHTSTSIWATRARFSAPIAPPYSVSGAREADPVGCAYARAD